MLNLKSVLRYVHVPALEFGKACNILRNAHLPIHEVNNSSFFESIKNDQHRLGVFVSCASDIYTPIHAPKTLLRLPVFYHTSIGLIADLNPTGQPKYLLCMSHSQEYIGRLTPFLPLSHFLARHAHQIDPYGYIHPLTFMTFYGCDPSLTGVMRPARPNTPFCYVWAVSKTCTDDLTDYRQQGFWFNDALYTGERLLMQNLCELDYQKASQKVASLALEYPKYHFMLVELTHES